MARLGGRQRGVGNLASLEKIKQHQSKLEKMLLDKALSGDVEAITSCLRLIAEQEEKPAPAPTSRRKMTPATQS